jgi:hypothetical protein
MDMTAFMQFFTKTDVPFTLLFCSLFFYTIKSNTSREHHMNQIIDERLNAMQEDMRVLLNVWKILLEKELKRQQGGNENDDSDKH